MNFKTTIEREILRMCGIKPASDDVWSTAIYEDKRKDVEQAMTNAAMAVLEMVENTDMRMSVVERARLKQIVETLKASLTTNPEIK